MKNPIKWARGLFQAKAVSIVQDNFIPREVVQFSDLLVGRTRQEEGLDANVVMAPVMWIMRTFPDAVARVERHEGEGKWSFVERHPVAQLIKRPTGGAYNGDALWQATVASYTLNGNAYWQKIRNRFGQVVQLWYRPHWCIKPHSPLDGSAFIDYYEYDTGRGIQRLDVRDVVHIRFGLDPRDTRYGFSPLRTLLREVMTDQEAARFSMRILENMGIPGVVISPSLNPTGDSFEPPPGEIEKLKDYIDTAFTGSQRGKALVFAQPTQVEQFGFDLKQLALGELRDGAEERVCAVLGLPSAVVGFGSGMDQTKVGATMDAQIKLAWKGCIFPMQRSMARQLDDQLLSDFVPNYDDRERMAFDTSEAVGLKEDPTEMSARVCNEVSAGILRVDQAQAMLGHEVDDTQKIYLRPMTVMPVTAEEVPEPTIHPQAQQVVEAGMQAEEDAANRPVAPMGKRWADLEPQFKEWLREQGITNGNGNGHHAEAA